MNTSKASKKRTIIRFIAALVSAVTVVIIFHNTSSAWLSKNKKVRRSNVKMNISSSSFDVFYKATDANGYTMLTDSNKTVYPVDYNALTLPDSYVEFDIGILNQTNAKSILKGISFDEPNIKGISSKTPYDEEPTKAGDYFGTQLSAYVESYTVYTNVTLSGGKPVLSGGSKTTVSNPQKPILLDSETFTSEELTLINNLGINFNKDTAVVFHIILKYNNGESNEQEQFKNFGTSTVGGSFSRTINFKFN